MSSTLVSIPVDKELVRILVIKGRLHIPEDHHTIYHYNPDGPKNPKRLPPTDGRPNELAWLVFGLPPEHEVEIGAKEVYRRRGFMRSDNYKLTAGNNPVFSGRPLKGPDPGQIEKWSYNITLKDPSGAVLDSCDPGVDIGNDP